MKRYVYLVFIGLATFIFASCEGPEGPPGKDGIDGDPGADMDASCKVCHNNVTSAMPAIFDEFKSSAHSLGTYYNRGGECAACHNTEGFLARIDYTSASDIYSFSGDAKSAISCYTCHNIHTDYEASDFSLTHAAQVTETIFGTKTTAYAGSFGDYGNGNLCLQCHQARDRGNVPTADATGTVSTNSHWGPHYGVQGNVLQASGGVHIGSGYPSATGGHAGIADACITCHMSGGNHDLSVNFDDGCISCHTAGNAEDLYDDLHDEIDALKHQLGKELTVLGAMVAEIESEWIWDGTQHVEVRDTVGFEPASGSIDADLAKAVYNYMVVYQDHSYGAHNPTYIRALLNNSLALIAAKK